MPAFKANRDEDGREAKGTLVFQLIINARVSGRTLRERDKDGKHVIADGSAAQRADEPAGLEKDTLSN